MNKNEFQEIVKILENKIGQTMPDHIRKMYWNDFGHRDFETVVQQFRAIQADENGMPDISVVVEGASEELTSEINNVMTTLLTTEVGDYVFQAMEKFFANKNKEKWEKEKKEYFKENNYSSLSLN